LKAVLGFVIALVFSFFIGKQVLGFIQKPVENELKKYWDVYYEKRAQAALNPENADDEDSKSRLPIDADFYVERDAFDDAVASSVERRFPELAKKGGPGGKEPAKRRRKGLNIVSVVRPTLKQMKL